ncbi:MAG: sulfurtransferase, partial [Dehalococcoidia bacterium]|nr:sulfurtransferase [Dehalococcoidia bacterium]
MTTFNYAHPEMLVESEWLAERLSDHAIRIVDCDITPSYQRAHIPGAVGIPNALATGDNYWKNPEDRVHVMTPEQ